jgi:hypothetical protein
VGPPTFCGTFAVKLKLEVVIVVEELFVTIPDALGQGTCSPGTPSPSLIVALGTPVGHVTVGVVGGVVLGVVGGGA